MAKFYSSTFGAISGKHGSAVAVTRKDGTTYIRMYAKPSNPRTDKQQAHRAKFALSSRALVPFNPIFKDTIGITNGISVARSHAFKNAIVGDYPNLSVDYEKLMFSFGTLEKLHNASVTRKGNVATLNWDFKEMYNCHADDSVSIVVFNKDAKQVLHIKDVALRADKSTKIEIHNAWADSELYFWAYVRGGDKISDSVFVGKCRTSDIIPDRSEHDMEQDGGVYVASTEVESRDEELKSNYEFNLFSAKEAVVGFIMMMCNLLSWFKQAVVGYNSQCFVRVLRCSAVGVAGCRDSIDNERVYNTNLWTDRRYEYDALCKKYNGIFRICNPYMFADCFYY